jgi:hypothetical protein
VTPAEYGDIFSVLLAIYRVQAELGIPTASSLLTQKQEQTRPSLDVFSSMQAAKAVGGQFTCAGNRLWCLAPAFEADGYPNFDSLRHLLTDLCSMARDGVIKSAYVLCGDSVTDGVKAMEQGTHLTCKLSGNAWLESSPLPLAILVETEKTIGASLIGTLTPAAEQKVPDLPVSIPSPSDRLIWSERPRVIVVAKPYDANAVMLTDALCKHGADALLVPDTENHVAPLSREILGAHFVILCHNAKPKTAPCMDFAWQTFAQAGGRIILLGNAKTQVSVPQIHLAKGFTPENLTQICQFER